MSNYAGPMVNIQIPMDVLVQAVKMAGVQDRLGKMLEDCGEVCSRNEAMRQLHVGAEKLETLIAANKIRLACEGEKIDVRSMAEYMDRMSDPKARYRL